MHCWEGSESSLAKLASSTIAARPPIHYIWLSHNLVEASFDRFRYLSRGDQLIPRGKYIHAGHLIVLLLQDWQHIVKPSPCFTSSPRLGKDHCSANHKGIHLCHCAALGLEASYGPRSWYACSTSEKSPCLSAWSPIP